MPKDLSQRHTEYYEAVLQLRDCNQEVADFVDNEIEKAGVTVAKAIELEKGIDYYLSDNKFTKQLGKKLQDKFGGDVKTTASLWGRKKDKEIYRLTVLFRGVCFKKGDKVEYKGEEYQVKLFLGNKLVLQKLETGEKVQMKCNQTTEIKRL